MIFPTDYRQRLLKQEKTRQYKAMLDDQIRQNYMHNQQRSHKRSNRLKTDPIQMYDYRSKINSSSRQLPHQSTFLPTINSTNVIDHGYRYGNNSGYQQKRYVSQLPSRRQTIQHQNDQQLDNQLQKCLQQCDTLIHGINKNFIHLNNHFRTNPNKPKQNQNKKQKHRNHSDFDMFRDQPNYNKQIDNYPITNLRGSQLTGYDNDIGRNEMMNYNLLKSKDKFNYFSPEKSHNSPSTNQDGFDNSFDKSQQKTKRKNPNDLLSSNSKLTQNKNNSCIDFDTINSDQQNQFDNIDALDHTKLKNMSKQIEQKRKQELVKKVKQQQTALQQMKKKDSHIIENLRKAKNRGNILFKKIEVFRKQRQQLEQSSKSLAENLQTKKDSKKEFRNSQSESKKSIVPQATQNAKESSKNLQRALKKEDISVNNPKKQQPLVNQDKQKINTDKRADSKISQKSP